MGHSTSGREPLRRTANAAALAWRDVHRQAADEECFDLTKISCRLKRDTCSRRTVRR